MRRYVAWRADRGQSDGDPRLDDPRVEEGVPALPRGERRGKRIEHRVAARRFAGAGKLGEAVVVGHHVASRWRTAS